MATSAMQAGTYHTKSIIAWAIAAARLPVIAAAQARSRVGMVGLRPPVHQKTHKTIPIKVRAKPAMPVSTAT